MKAVITLLFLIASNPAWAVVIRIPVHGNSNIGWVMIGIASLNFLFWAYLVSIREKHEPVFPFDLKKTGDAFMFFLPIGLLAWGLYLIGAIK